jgi:hypothetical protein
MLIARASGPGLPPLGPGPCSLVLIRNFNPEGRLIARVTFHEDTLHEKAAVAFAVLAVFASPSLAQSVGEKTA